MRRKEREETNEATEIRDVDTLTDIGDEHMDALVELEAKVDELLAERNQLIAQRDHLLAAMRKIASLAPTGDLEAAYVRDRLVVVTKIAQVALDEHERPLPSV